MDHLTRAAMIMAAQDNRAFKLEDHPVFCAVSIAVFLGAIVYLLFFKGRGGNSDS